MYTVGLGLCLLWCSQPISGMSVGSSGNHFLWHIAGLEKDLGITFFFYKSIITASYSQYQLYMD